MHFSKGPRRLSTVIPRRDSGYSMVIQRTPSSSEVFRAPPRYSKVVGVFSEVLRGPGASRNHPELFRTLRNPAKTLYLWSVSTRYNIDEETEEFVPEEDCCDPEEFVPVCLLLLFIKICNIFCISNMLLKSWEAFNGFCW